MVGEYKYQLLKDMVIEIMVILVKKRVITHDELKKILEMLKEK